MYSASCKVRGKSQLDTEIEETRIEYYDLVYAKYEYYIQNESGQFVRDAFLSEEMQIFPHISTTNKTLITFHSTMVDSTTTTYKLDAATGKWRVIKREVTVNDAFIPIGPDHDWTVSIGDRWFGFICFPSRTEIGYGVGSVEMPFHFSTLAGFGSAIPLLACAIYVYAQRRRHRAQVAANRIISPAAPAP